MQEKKNYLDGLAEGEKTGKEKQWIATEKAQKKTSSKIKELDKVNAELKAQIEKMKNCANCKHWIVKVGFDSKCDLKEPCDFGKRNKWELKG